MPDCYRVFYVTACEEARDFCSQKDSSSKLTMAMTLVLLCREVGGLPLPPQCCDEYGAMVCQPGFGECHTWRNENLLRALACEKDKLHQQIKF